MRTIDEVKSFETKEEAESYGARFVESWGWAYFAKAYVYHNKVTGNWVCNTSRTDSCD